MKEVVLGIDVGTSAVKVIAVTKYGEVLKSVHAPVKTMNFINGYSEQNPDDWFEGACDCIKQLIHSKELTHYQVTGLSLSGQMHSLVILDDEYKPIRNAILWNDTRSTFQCNLIKKKLGDYVLDNPVLEGFTLTKLLWIKENEPNHWLNTEVFLLPKDYVRFKLTDKLNMEYSDASSTLLLDNQQKCWAKEVGRQFGIDHIYPNLVNSDDFVGYVTEHVAQELGLNNLVAVFAGGGDNACGALGSGVIADNQTLCSIGTSGVVLSCESDKNADYQQNMHYFNHVVTDMSYVMGVTLAAGDSLRWLKNNILPHLNYDQIISKAKSAPLGSNGLLFTPYLSGERTPHGDASIRGSFIGLKTSHNRNDIARSVIEGITFSLYESINYLRHMGKTITSVTSIGGGAQSDFWLQLQADIFNTKIKKLKHEEGPCMGAAMLAALGLGWYEHVADITKHFIKYEYVFEPDSKRHKQYMAYFELYQAVYQQTQSITAQLLKISDVD
ncbi:xylulokinase [Staphylococcus edaphicus]|uniref:Xylulose kinase n=1 Tax=Staphylococcus edaphicus TaxID=1955013 RepID=A0A2C6WQU2_9STAP|nr:xylulokinase [Staphylococcus edaphicus]PHK50116.1 xylulokinase [Staphylococcus edaphicus]UQW81613.1 xylulokinase [Staphylococcus edaphicus]